MASSMVDYRAQGTPIVLRPTRGLHKIHFKQNDFIQTGCGIRRLYTQFTYDQGLAKDKCTICFVTSIYTGELVEASATTHPPGSISKKGGET